MAVHIGIEKMSQHPIVDCCERAARNEEGDPTEPDSPPPWRSFSHEISFGWRAVLSSSNPWVLAELQQALLQHPAAEREGLPEEHSEERSEESSGEVIVVRVALPSAAERKHVRELATRHTPSVFICLWKTCLW